MRIAAIALTLFIGLAAFASAKEQSQPNAPQALGTKTLGAPESPIFVRGDVSVKKDDREVQMDAEERRLKGEADSRLVQYTGYLAVSTFLLFVFTALLWVATWRLGAQAKQESKRQAQGMDRSIAEAVRSANAMEKVAVATVQNAQLMSGMLQGQMRAYVSAFVSGATHQTENLVFEMRMTMRNEGLTPARNVTYRSMVGVLPAGIGPDYVFPEPLAETRNDASLGPRQELGIGAGLLAERMSEEDAAIVMLGRDRRLYAWGTISYDDIFGNRWNTNFCQNVYWITSTVDGKQDVRWFSQYHNSHNDST